MAKYDQWKIVDEHGDDVMTAETVSAAAHRCRKSTKFVAQREAKLLVNTDAGDAPVYAVKL